MEEQPEIQEPTVEEQLTPETSKPTKLNKNGKPRKQLTPEALERLAKAREKANVMRQQNYAKKLEEKVEKIKSNQGKRPETANKEGVVGEELPCEETNDDDKAKAEVILPEPEKEIKEVVEKKVKPKGKKKTKIIVEQSSDDSDEFEQNDNVVFVKRVSRKKKEPVLERQPAMELPPPDEPPTFKPPPKQITPEQMMLRNNYNSMFSGNFLNNNYMRRHY